MSNSAITRQIVAGSTGPQGATGFTGNTGATGSGNTGATGDYGLRITGATLLSSGAGLFFQLSDGTGVTVYGNFRGATTTELLNSAESIGSEGEDIFADITDGLISFKGISASGSLTSYVSGLTLYIDTIYSGGEGQLDVTVQDNKVMYLKDIDTASTTTIDVVSDSTFDVLDFGLTASFLNDQVIVNYYGPVERGQVVGLDGSLEDFTVGTTGGIFVDLSKAGVHFFRTPIGVAGFTGEFINATTSALLVFESDEVWKFPENVYFPENENYLTCGKTFVSIKSRGKNSSSGQAIWLAKIVARGLDINFNGASGGVGTEPAEVVRITDSCVSNTMMGSCCYLDSLGTQRCMEYKTKRDCDALFGLFTPNKNCSNSCSNTLGACCSGGKCLDDVTFDECQYFGGRFHSGITCGTYPHNENGKGYDEPIQEGRLCVDPCTSERHACCKDGICLGTNFTRIECELILGGVSVKDTVCSDASCCLINIEKGACCRPGQDCEDNQSYKTCLELKGVFMGPGEVCANVNCDCVTYENPGSDFCTPVTKGACCYEQNGNTYCTDGVTRENCDALDGTYYEDQTCEEVDCEDIQPEPKGACCLPKVSAGSFAATRACCTEFGCVDTTSFQCVELNGTWSADQVCCLSPLTEAECIAKQGDYQGDNTNCDLLKTGQYNTCCYDSTPPDPGVCCFEKIETGQRVCVERPDVDECERIDEILTGWRLVESVEGKTCDSMGPDWCKTPEVEPPPVDPCEGVEEGSEEEAKCLFGCCCVFFPPNFDIPYPGLFATHGYGGWYKGVAGQLPPGPLSDYFPSKWRCENKLKGSFCGEGAVCPTYADMATQPAKGTDIGGPTPSGSPTVALEEIQGNFGCCCPGHKSTSSFPTVPGIPPAASPFTYVGECKGGGGGGGGGGGEQKYACIPNAQGINECVEDESGSFESIEDCQAVCINETVAFGCVDGTCQEKEDGEYASLEECQAVDVCDTNPKLSYQFVCRDTVQFGDACVKTQEIVGDPSQYNILEDCLGACSGAGEIFSEEWEDLCCNVCKNTTEPETLQNCAAAGCQYFKCTTPLVPPPVRSLKFATKDDYTSSYRNDYGIKYKLFTHYINGVKTEDCLPTVGNDIYISSLPDCKSVTTIQNPNTIGKCCQEKVNKFTGKEGGDGSISCLKCTATTQSKCTSGSWSTGSCTNTSGTDCDPCGSGGCCCTKDAKNPSAIAPYDRCSGIPCRNCAARGGKWVNCASCGESSGAGARCNCADLDWKDPDNPVLKPEFKPGSTTKAKPVVKLN